MRRNMQQLLVSYQGITDINHEDTFVALNLHRHDLLMYPK